MDGSGKIIRDVIHGYIEGGKENSVCHIISTLIYDEQPFSLRKDKVTTYSFSSGILNAV